MDLKRMKFAWARGARFQHLDFHDVWNDLPPSTCPVYENYDRIHPDCAHLEYGPLSTDLRRRAIEKDLGECEVAWFDGIVKLPLWLGVWIHMDMGDQVWRTLTADGRMFMLFLAEMLADEGL